MKKDIGSGYVITAATENYGAALARLLLTFFKTNPTRPIKVYLIDWSGVIAKQFQTYFNAAEFYRLQLGVTYGPNGKSGETLRHKVQIIQDSYFDEKHNLIWIDADCIVLKDMTPLFLFLKDFSLLVYRRPIEKKEVTYNLSVVGCSKMCDGKTVSMFLKDLCDTAFKVKNKRDWFHDQIAFYQTMMRYPHLSYYSLTEDHNSLGGNRNAIIYTRPNPNSLIEKEEEKQLLSEIRKLFDIPQQEGK